MSQLVDPLPAHRFDEAALHDYLAAHLPEAAGPFRVRQFQGGQSNPTFLLEGEGWRMVLRKKPSGALLKSAHQVEREYRVISALQGSAVPVPRSLLLCEDAGVIGTAFYLMDYVEGRVFETPDMPGSPPQDRTACYRAMVATMAALHNVDWQAAGLADFGRPGNYVVRQLERWSKQYRDTAVDGVDPLVEEIIAWLEANLPGEARTTLAHGDFRLGNLVFDQREPVVRAVLDWELSTLGDPLGDLAYCCLPYHLPAGGGDSRGLLGLDLKALGIPAEEDLLDAYCAATGRGRIDGWTFYLVFSLFRLIAILQGVYARAMQGNASSANALAVAGRRKVMARTASQMIAGKQDGG
ncbi:MAG: phosphotransferase family protein [Hyphomicrobiales bacterium]|nr:MAG: phosphotransferase family protein [Hyphomicrobiales bacterium]